MTSEPNREQAANWNHESGQAWVEMQRPLDEMFAPLEKVLVEHAVDNKTRRLLDIGCGSGSTTLAAARRMGPNGSCVGVDISVPLLELAKQRASEAHVDRVTFVRADAQTHEFKPQAFDA